jgi:hypothetical protein
MKRIIVAATAMLAATAANAQCLGTTWCRSGPDEMTKMQNSNMYNEQMRTMQNLNRQMETITPSPMPQMPAPLPEPEGPGLLGTIIGLSQQSELHEKQMQVLEAQRKLLEAQRRQITGAPAPSEDDDFHPVRVGPETTSEDLKPRWMRRMNIVALRNYCMSPTPGRREDCNLWGPK